MQDLRGQSVVVALSGGVDSAVAALLLLEAGARVQALYMDNWDSDDEYCTAAADYRDARSVARDLDIPLHRVSFAAQYRERVFAGFLAEYCSGRTPNPDVLCNREIKFDLCTNYAQRLGGNHFATGHYAKMQYDSDGPALYKAADGDKDQSYFLHAVPRAAFTNVVFPLGSMHKPEVRERARRAGLAVGNKADSTGICFIGERPFEEFLARYIPDSPGDIETLTGEVVGRHRGLPFYTLGQRDGLKIGGRRDHAPEPWYVVRKDAARNALLVAQKHDTTALECTRLRTGPPNWQISQPQLPLEACVKLRYRQPDQVAQIAADCHGGLELRFETPQRAATSGQFAVFYHQERCLGGAQIVETL